MVGKGLRNRWETTLSTVDLLAGCTIGTNKVLEEKTGRVLFLLNIFITLLLLLLLLQQAYIGPCTHKYHTPMMWLFVQGMHACFVWLW